MKYVLVVLLFLLVSLQVRLFFGDGSVREMLVLKKVPKKVPEKPFVRAATRAANYVSL